jgi:hypothetical protein
MRKLVGAEGIEPATLDWSGSIRVKENSVKLMDFSPTTLQNGAFSCWIPLLRENKTSGCPIQRVLEIDFVVVTGRGTARDFIRLLTVELH